MPLGTQRKSGRLRVPTFHANDDHVLRRLWSTFVDAATTAAAQNTSERIRWSENISTMFCCLSLLSSAPDAFVATKHVLTMKGRTWGGRTAGEWASLSTHLKHNGSLRTKTRLVMQSNTLATTMTELGNVCSVSAAESVTSRQQNTTSQVSIISTFFTVIHFTR